MSKMSDMIRMYAAMAMIASPEFSSASRKMGPKDRPIPEPIKEIHPAGTREYFFDNDGEFCDDSMHPGDVVFTCWATNDRNAMRKFYNWNIKR